MSAGQTAPLLRRTALRGHLRPDLRLVQEARLNNRYSRLASSSTSTAAVPGPKRIQPWQAVLLGSLATVAVQGIVLYANSPPSATSASSDQLGIQKLEDALDSIHQAGIETSVVQDVLQGYATAPGTSYPPSLPLAVAYPTSTEDVVQIVNACRESNVREST